MFSVQVLKGIACHQAVQVYLCMHSWICVYLYCRQKSDMIFISKMRLETQAQTMANDVHEITKYYFTYNIMRFTEKGMSNLFLCWPQMVVCVMNTEVCGKIFSLFRVLALTSVCSIITQHVREKVDSLVYRLSVYKYLECRGFRRCLQSIRDSWRYTCHTITLFMFVLGTEILFLKLVKSPWKPGKSIAIS